MGCVSVLGMASGGHCFELVSHFHSDLISEVYLVTEVTARLTVALRPEVKSHQ